MPQNLTRTSGISNSIQGLSSLIGNTPLLEICFSYNGKSGKIYAKAEHLNMTGSIKDRMALHIVREAYRKNLIKPGDRIVEATSGNTGIAFAAVGRALGHPVTIFMPDWMSDERKNLIRSFGADIVLVSKEEGGFIGSIERTREMAASGKDIFLPRQFENNDNIVAHYTTTGPEIWWQLRFHDIVPDAFVAGVGTGGTIMGTGRYLKEMNPAIKLYPLEPSNSPTMSTGYKVGAHRIQGISDEFIPPIVRLDELDEVIAVDDGDSIIMAQKLANELGIAVGISSGANFLGALTKLEELGFDSTVVTVFSDDNKKYLTTGLMKKEPVRTNFLSTHIKLTSFRALKRSCIICCNPAECESIVNSEAVQDIKFPACYVRSIRKQQ
ncbi:MAG: PLP-dependent cysteine synthase family protein [Bacteroidales bacterium]|nr:PLP-dependent cysteine synthase family protein [Bacteroidales bacterium]